MISFGLQRAFEGDVWLMTLSGLKGLYNCLSEFNPGMSLDDIESYSEFYGHREAAYIDGQGIAHIEVKNALLSDIPPAYEKLGFATSYETLTREFNEVVGAAKGILLHINSPGGMVSGNAEFAELVQNSPIPTAAMITGKGCSAAYYIAAGCDIVVSSKSADVGNIGAVLSIMNRSKMLEAIGLTVVVMTNDGASLKSAGHLAELTTEQREFLQERLNQMGIDFRNHVERSRMVDEEVYKAGWHSGQRALNLGLVDMIGSKDDAMSYLLAETVEA